MQRYEVTPQPSKGCIPVVTIIFPTTKVDHPFDVEDIYPRNTELLLKYFIVSYQHITT